MNKQVEGIILNKNGVELQKTGLTSLENCIYCAQFQVTSQNMSFKKMKKRKKL